MLVLSQNVKTLGHGLDRFYSAGTAYWITVQARRAALDRAIADVQLSPLDGHRGHYALLPPCCVNLQAQSICEGVHMHEATHDQYTQAR